MCDLLRSSLDVSTFPTRPCSAHAAGDRPHCKPAAAPTAQGVDMSATTTTSDHSLDTPVVDTLLEAIRAGRGIPESDLRTRCCARRHRAQLALHRDRTGSHLGRVQPLVRLPRR